MKRMTGLGWVLVLVAGAWLLPNRSGAIPTFARKYNFNCIVCHTNYPRLNDFGELFRRNGYQLPGGEAEEKTILESPPPFSVRLVAGYDNDHFRHVAGAQNLNLFEVDGIDLLSGGLLYKNIGYYALYPPQVNPERGLAGQDGTVEFANAIFSNLAKTWLNLRAGRLEPSATGLSMSRQLTFSPYEIYEFTFPGGFPLGDPQTGLEATGYGHGFNYAAGFVNGAATNHSDDGPQDLYGRIAQVIGKGEGQTAGQRIGIIGYHGEARPDPSLPPGAQRVFSRYGADLSLNVKKINLSVQYLIGQDNKYLWGLNKNMNFTGGFAELIVIPTGRLLLLARYDWVDTPKEVDQDIARWTGAARYYFKDHLALHAEYSHREVQQPGPRAFEDFLTGRLDFAF
jgi:hypothetical protein